MDVKIRPTSRESWLKCIKAWDLKPASMQQCFNPKRWKIQMTTKGGKVFYFTIGNLAKFKKEYRIHSY